MGGWTLRYIQFLGPLVSRRRLPSTGTQRGVHLQVHSPPRVIVMSLLRPRKDDGGDGQHQKQQNTFLSPDFDFSVKQGFEVESGDF